MTVGALGVIAEIEKDDSLARQALEALMEGGLEHSRPFIAQQAALELGFFLRQERYRLYFESVWNRLGLREIQFRDGRGSQSTTSFFMRNYLDQRAPTETPLPIEEVPFVKRETTLNQFLSSQGALAEKERLGRSVLYSLPNSSDVLVIKYLKTDNPEDEVKNEKKLIRELQAQAMVKKINPRSTFPDPVRDESGRIVFFQFENGKKGIAFRASPNYYRYLDDPTLSDEEFLKGLKNAVYDSFLLARYHLFHTVPIAIFHDTPGSRPDGGRFITSVDLLPQSLEGMGSLNDWPDAIRFGNGGVDGLRDLEEIAIFKEILDPSGEYQFELSKLQGLQNVAPLMEALILKKTLLAPQLLIGNRLAAQVGDRWAEAWRDDLFLQKYADWHLKVFAGAHEARWKISEEDAVESLRERADWLRMARQIAIFQTPAHARIFKQGMDPRQIPTDLIFGKGVVVKGQTPEALGPYRPETFDEARGFSELEVNPEALSLGPVNGAYPITEFDKASWAVFLEPEVQ